MSSVPRGRREAPSSPHPRFPNWKALTQKKEEEERDHRSRRDERHSRWLPTTTAPVTPGDHRIESNRAAFFSFRKRGRGGLFDGLFLFFLRGRPSIPAGDGRGGRRKKEEEEQKTLLILNLPSSLSPRPLLVFLPQKVSFPIKYNCEGKWPFL